MDYLTHQLLNPEKAKEIVKRITSKESGWKDGKLTAGKYASKVKNNKQLEKESNEAQIACDYIITEIKNNQLLKSFSIPQKIHGVMFSKTEKDEGYGMHVDNAYMTNGRSDLSFTIFLSNPKDYKGGELCIQNLQDVQEIKLEIGEIIIYPSTSLHSVNMVTNGIRYACVGWIQSYITSNEDRNILFSLDAAGRGIISRHGQSEESDLIFQSYNNLLRRLGK
tara:strand:- start:700 stop:1365 length:666 start_codon:yes stop_codon:yes gene_type:complete